MPHCNTDKFIIIVVYTSIIKQNKNIKCMGDEI